MDPLLQGITLSVVPAVLTGIISAVISSRLTINAFVQKRGELQLVAQNRFYELYGEFLAIWRVWNSVQPLLVAEVDGPAVRIREGLLDRATQAEGRVESILLKLCSERELTDPQLDSIGIFRQAYSLLRKSILRKEEVPFTSSNDRGYLALKTLSIRVGNLIASNAPTKPPAPQRAIEQFMRVTSNDYEGEWRNFDDAAIRVRAKSRA